MAFWNEDEDATEFPDPSFGSSMDELSPPTSPSCKAAGVVLSPSNIKIIKQRSNNNLPPRINRVTSDMSSDMNDILSPTFDSASIQQDDSFRSLGPSPQSSMGDGNYLSQSYSADSIIRRVEEEIAAARNAASSAKNRLSDRQQQQQQRQQQESQLQSQWQEQKLYTFSMGSMGSGLGSMGSGDEDMKAMLDVGVDIYVEDGLNTAEVNSMLDEHALPQSSSMADNYEKAMDLFDDEFANGNEDENDDVDSDNSEVDEAIELVFSTAEASEASDPFEDEDWQQPAAIVDSNSNGSDSVLQGMEDIKSTPLAPVLEMQEEEDLAGDRTSEASDTFQDDEDWRQLVTANSNSNNSDGRLCTMEEIESTPLAPALDTQEEEDLTGDPLFDGPTLSDEQSIMRIQSSASKELEEVIRAVAVEKEAVQDEPSSDDTTGCDAALASRAKLEDSDTTSYDAQMENYKALQNDMSLKSNDAPTPTSKEKKILIFEASGASTPIDHYAREVSHFEVTESHDVIYQESKDTPAEQPEEMESVETSGAPIDHDSNVEPSSEETQDDINLKPSKAPADQPEEMEHGGKVELLSEGTEPQDDINLKSSDYSAEQFKDKEDAITSSTYVSISKDVKADPPMETRDDEDSTTNDAPPQQYEEKESVQASGTNTANELLETESKGDKNLESDDGPAQSETSTAEDEKWLSEITSGDAVASDANNAPAMDEENELIDLTNITLEIDEGEEQAVVDSPQNQTTVEVLVNDDLVNTAIEGGEENIQTPVVSSPIGGKQEISSPGASKGQPPMGANRASPKRRGIANAHVAKGSEKAEASTEKDLTGKFQRIRFRDPFPKLRMGQAPRDPLTVFDEHVIRPPIGKPRWTKPTKTLKQLINAVIGPSLQRRSNACGALKVLTTQKKNLKSLARMDGFLSSMIFAVAEDISSSEKTLALDARTRAMTCLRNVCEPKENRVRVCAYEGLPECLMKVIREDGGEARVLACGALALLAKTPSCREDMARTKGLIDILAEVLSGEVPVPVVEPEEEKKEDDGEESLSSEGSSIHDEDDDHSSHSGSSFFSEGSALVDAPDDQARASIRKRNEGMHDEFLQRARSNACAALLHLSKHCPVTVRIHRQREFQLKRNVHVYSPVYSFIAFPTTDQTML
jgi:hypothetical protein